MRGIAGFVLAGSLCLVLAGCGPGTQGSDEPVGGRTDSTTEAPGDTPSVSSFRIVSYHGNWDGDTLRVIGEVKNAGTVAAGPQIEVIARDANGVLVDSQQFWPMSIKNLPPGLSCGMNYAITTDRRAKSLEANVVAVEVW
jgi:hypothetical protein